MICLLANCCFLSETSRLLEIHRALVARGAAVCVATHGGPHVHTFADAGVPYEVLGPGWNEERAAAFVRSVPGIGRPDQSMWSDDEIRTYVALEAAYFDEHAVDAVVTGWTLTALLSTRVAGIPLVTEHAGSFIPPVFERGRLPAPSTPLGIPLERWLPESVRRRLFNARVVRLDIYNSGFNRIAGELGIDGVPSFPALLLGDLTLVTDVPEVLGLSVEDIDKWVPTRPERYRAGTRLRYTGPLYAKLAVAIPARVDAFLAGPRPVVYVAITSSGPDLVRAVVAALEPLGVRVLVAATVHDLDDLDGDDVCVAGVLPSHEIMPRVDLAVTAGGQGSVQTAIAAGVPLIGIPLQPEQDANVEFVRRHGAAALIAPNAAGTAALTRTARAMLADRRYRVRGPAPAGGLCRGRRCRRRRRRDHRAGGLGDAAPPPGAAVTYSIVARDAETGQLGVAVQSCMFGTGSIVPWARAGVGAVATQAFADPGYGPRCLDALAAGSSASDALALAQGADPMTDLRQVGVVAADGTAAVTTGALCVDHAGHTQGDGFVAEANMVAGPEVWIAMADVFAFVGR